MPPCGTIFILINFSTEAHIHMNVMDYNTTKHNSQWDGSVCSQQVQLHCTSCKSLQMKRQASASALKIQSLSYSYCFLSFLFLSMIIAWTDTSRAVDQVDTSTAQCHAQVFHWPYANAQKKMYWMDSQLLSLFYVPQRK